MLGAASGRTGWVLCRRISFLQGERPWPSRSSSIHSRADCFCGKVKEFLSQKGITYQERDVAQDARALEDLERLGVITTPVTMIDGEVVVGFDRPKLERLLV